MFRFTVFCVCLFISTILADRRLTFKNRCAQTIWISPLTNNQGDPIGEIQKLDQQQEYAYIVPDSGWGGRFWPKTGCDGSGQNCQVGQSMPPCPTNGCQVPAETKVEFFYPQIDSSDTIWYDVSLVDGYSLPMDILPSTTVGSCVATKCDLSLSECPSGENEVGDLRVIQDNRIIQCVSPCKKWNFIMKKNEQEGVGLDFCCPTPPVSVEQCRKGKVVRSKYVDLIHRTCPSAYSYAYDDEAGLHNCPNPTSFVVNIC